MAKLTAFLASRTDPAARLFINISHRGCSSGCSYCYVEDFAGPQVLVSHTELIEGVDRALADPMFEPGQDGTIVSFCPDTEPFKSNHSAALLLIAVERVARRGNRMQIATKEVVPVSFLKACGRLQSFAGQFVLFVSITSFQKAAKIEPLAAPPIARLINFNVSRDAGIMNCFYIKPFTNVTRLELEEFVNAIDKVRPSALCVGMLYQPNITPNNSVGRHPAHSELQTRGLGQALNEFCSALQTRCQVPLFHTSVCATAALSDTSPRPDIHQVIPSLCTNCGNRRCQSAVT